MIYSGFFRRFFAFIIDTILVFIPITLISGPMLISQALFMGENPTDLQLALTGIMTLSAQLISILISWLYYALLESGKHQATWGKRLLGIKVVGKNGERITFARATGRFFAKTLCYLTVYIGFIMIGFTNRKRGLHDMVAETYVVKKDFCQGNELPPTPSHKFLLALVCIGWLILLLAGSIIASQFALTPTQSAAKLAAQRLVNLAGQNTHLTTPLRVETSTFYEDPEGYRAIVVDPVSSNKFTLLLPKGANQVCCKAFPLGDCQSTGFVDCNN